MSKTCEQSGVDIHAGHEAVERVFSHAQRIMRKEVLGGLSGLGVIFDLSQFSMRTPVLVSGIDGVGTKLKFTIDHDKYDTIGTDAAVMCTNDILIMGIEPLCFLGYIVTSRAVPKVIEQIIKGVSDDCKAAHTTLIDGGTAEVGRMCYEGEYNLAGFAVGAVERDEYIDGPEVEEGQIITGLASSGTHSNGYSLVGRSIEGSGIGLNDLFDGGTYPDIFLAPTQLYVKPILTLREKIRIEDTDHITDGGFYESIPRGLPKGLTAKVDTQSSLAPKVSEWLQQQAETETSEMYNAFNIGMDHTVIVNREDIYKTLDALEEQDTAAYQIGEIVRSNDAPIYLEGM